MRRVAVLALAAVAETFGYRRLNNLWRVRGGWRYMRGERGWGAMTRKGFRG